MYRVAITAGILFGIIVSLILLAILVMQQRDLNDNLTLQQNNSEKAWADVDPQLFYVLTLSSNQVFVGKITQIDERKLTLEFAYYLQSVVDPATQAVTQKLVNRSNELHQPDYTIINVSQVVLFEPVRQDSNLAALLAKAKSI